MDVRAQRVALYLRVSTEMQARKDTPIAAQRKELAAFCVSRGWEVVAEYVDAGESARSDDRPQFQKMVTDARAKHRPFDTVLVYAFDRFARNRFDAAIHKRDL